MATAELDSRWSAHFPHRSRPTAYTSREPESDGFLPLADFDDFKVEDLQTLSQAQLYVLGEAGYAALVELQKEWRELERQAQHVKLRDPLPVPYKDPQLLPSREIFEERKEASLYNYKYDAHKKMVPTRYTVPGPTTDQEKFDCREPQEPFAQGGFVPTDKQYKAIIATAKAEGRPLNPDKQIPYSQNAAFFDRPDGTWIAKAVPVEAPLAPRTRARAALTTTAERQTRFNGEKVPMTRDISSGTAGVASPITRTATPATGASPAPFKRTIDAVDITHELPPRKKHPNQYTKRREREQAESLAIQQAASSNGHTATVSDQAPSPAPLKKKHPNQYTKRREREELERRLKDEEKSRDQEEQSGTALPTPTRALSEQYPESTTPGGFAPSPASASPFSLPYHMPQASYTPPAVSKPKHPNQYTKQKEKEEWAQSQQVSKQSRGASPAMLGEKAKHPNQYTKRREQEEAARRLAFHQQQGLAGPYGGPSPFGLPQVHPYPYQYHQPYTRPAPPTWIMQPYQPMQIQPVHIQQQPPVNMPVAVTTTNTKGKDPSIMSKEELRTHLFKDQDLLAFLHKDHSWLNEDPVKAAEWKNKILQSEYPVRTWAMLRKWKEWKAEGKDKRPRDKDGNRIKDTSTVPLAPAEGMNLIPVLPRPMEVPQTTADEHSGSRLPLLWTSSQTPTQLPAATSEHPAIDPSNGLRRSASPAPRSVKRLRMNFDTPRSPLVNGMNARDIATDRLSPGTPTTQARSFGRNLQVLHSGEVDVNTKVDNWHDRNISVTGNDGALQNRPLSTWEIFEAVRRDTYVAPPREQRNFPLNGELQREHDMSSVRMEEPVECSNPSLRPTQLDTNSASAPSTQPPREQLKKFLQQAGEAEMQTASNSSATSADESDPDDTDYGSRSRSRRQPRRTPTPKVQLDNKSGVRASVRSSTRTKPVDSLKETSDNSASRTTRSRALANGDLQQTQATEKSSIVENVRRQPSRSSTQSLSPVATRRNGLRPHPLKRVVSGGSAVGSSEEGEEEKEDTKSISAATPTRRSARNLNLNNASTR